MNATLETPSAAVELAPAMRAEREVGGLQYELGPHAREELGAVLRDYLSATTRLAATHEALQHEVARLRNELESKDRELTRRQRLASLGELAAGVAHEVRNPLGAIQLYSGLLRSACGGAGPARDLLDKIDGGIRAIDAIVQDTLALTPRGGRLESLPIAPIVEQARESCNGVLAASGVRCDVTIEDETIAAPIDARAIQRVLINLISNAAEASPREATVRVHVAGAGGGRMRVSVVDQGPGIPAGCIDRIFDPFYTTKARGTGLGLAIAHRLVDAHGGRLSAQNRNGGGAEFVMELPTSARGRQEAEPVEAGIEE